VRVRSVRGLQTRCCFKLSKPAAGHVPDDVLIQLVIAEQAFSLLC